MFVPSEEALSVRDRPVHSSTTPNQMLSRELGARKTIQLVEKVVIGRHHRIIQSRELKGIVFIVASCTEGRAYSWESDAISVWDMEWISLRQMGVRVHKFVTLFEV